MEFTEEHFYHIYNRGNNSQKIFFTDANYLFFLDKVKKELSAYCDILTYCLMPNHFHLEVFVKSNPDKLNKGIAILLRSYTRAIQKQQGFTGSLFQQKTKAKDLSLEDGYLTRNRLSICAHYIHQNPAKAGLVTRLSDWRYSSFNEYLNAAKFNYCNIELALDYMGVNRQEFIDESYQLISDYYLNEDLS